MQPCVTILTPTYNRGKLLLRIYESLCRQDCCDFEWVIVDDGSTDNTEEIVNYKLRTRNSKFKVRYFKKENGGKHTAVNLGVKESRGELTLILDSDDELPRNAIKDIKEEWNKAKSIPTSRKQLGGVCGYMAHRNGIVIGKPMVKDFCDEITLRYSRGVQGDMCEVFRSDVLREFPFPEIKDEKFCPESLVWNRIAQKYCMSVFPKVIYLRDYLEGGLTDNIVRIRMQSPIASMMTYQEMTGYDVPFKIKIRSAINYWRFRFCYHKRKNSTICVPALKKIWNILYPIGFLMHIRDVVKKLL